MNRDALEAEIRKLASQDPDLFRYVAHVLDLERSEGVCAECGNINNPGHAVQAGGFCACDYSARCYGQEEGHYLRGGKCIECGQVPVPDFPEGEEGVRQAVAYTDALARSAYVGPEAKWGG